ncbi:MAG: hypothetical protein JST30_01085 [Armatimonadetes bacterium]|nr:hypothetical protein [Armatimonadota bacterium]
MLNALLAFAADGKVSSSFEFFLEFSGSRYAVVERQVNVSSHGLQSAPTLAIGRDGRCTVAWQGQRSNQGQGGVLVRSFDAFGRPLDTERPATSDTAHSHLAPSAVEVDGRTLVAHESRYRGGNNLDLYLGATRMNGQTVGDRRDVVTAAGPRGTWAAAWLAEVAPGATRVFVRTFDSSGRPLGPERQVSETPSGQDLVPSLVATDDGFAVAWQRISARGRLLGVYGRLLGPDGRRVGRDVTLTGPSAIEPSLTTAGTGFVLGWVEQSGPKTVVRGARLDKDLRRTGETLRVTGQDADQNAATVAGRSDGRFVVAWNKRSPADRDVYVQPFLSDGRPSGPAVRVNSQSKGDQSLIEASGKRQLAYDETGVTIVWSQGKSGQAPSSVQMTKLIDIAGLDRSVSAALAPRPEDTVARFGDSDRDSRTIMRFDRKATSFAGPHEPPVQNVTRPQDRWGFQVPMANGGFNAYTQTSFTPPDMNLAVGPEHVVVTVNDGIAFYTKNGTSTYSNNMRLTNGFWGSLAASDNFIYDPECFFDRGTGRFWVMATQGAGTSADSAALVAVSDDSDPNGVWYTYRFLTTSLAGNFFDSPNFGVDDQVLYVTGDGFGISSNYPVFCIDKTPMLTGGNPSVIKSTTLSTSTQSAGMPQVQPGTGPWYLVEHKEATNNTAIDLVALRNPLTTPNLVRFTLTVPSYSAPEDPPQSGSSSRVNTFDARMWSVKAANGFIWASHHVNGSQVRGRWYQIDPRGWPVSGNNPVVVQSGELDPGTGVRSFFPAIAADDADNVGFGYSRGATNEFYSAAHAYRNKADGAGTSKGHAIDMVSTGPYTAGRWGDYSGCDADPAYPGLFWSYAEWSQGSTWNSWVQPFYVTNAIWATQLTLIRGQAVSGSVKDMVYDDGVEAVHKSFVRATATDPYIRYELKTRTFRKNQTSANVEFAYRVSAPGFKLRTELMDTASGVWNTVDYRDAATTDSAFSVSVANPTNYIDPATGTVRARVSVEKGVGPVATNAVNLFSDKWNWVEN